MSEPRGTMSEPPSAQGAAVAGARYADKLGPGDALVLRHGGSHAGRWWLLGVLSLAEAHALYAQTLAALPRDSHAKLAVWFDGGCLRFGELMGPEIIGNRNG